MASVVLFDICWRQSKVEAERKKSSTSTEIIIYGNMEYSTDPCDGLMVSRMYQDS